MDSVAEYLLPQANAQPDESDMQLASSNQVMSDAPGIVPIPQTGFEKVMEKTGLTLEQIGSELDKLGKVNIGGVEIGIRDLLPFVGSIEDGKLTGTPAALQAAGRGESLITGTGFTTQLKPDAKMMALDVATAGVAKPMFQAGKAAAKGVAKALPKDLPVGMSIKSVDDVPLKASDFANELKGKFGGLELDMYDNSSDNLITLSRISLPKESRGQGTGSSVINEITKFADENGKTIALSPSKDFGATSVTRLKDFYKQFGFVENKGKNKDFSISESMYRKPMAQENK
jgi:GNAT superfamily N-acetyltransferase